MANLIFCLTVSLSLEKNLCKMYNALSCLVREPGDDCWVFAAWAVVFCLQDFNQVRTGDGGARMSPQDPEHKGLSIASGKTSPGCTGDKCWTTCPWDSFHLWHYTLPQGDICWRAPSWICQLQTGACWGHLPSASVKIDSCAAVALGASWESSGWRLRHSELQGTWWNKS